ncbi:unnamed protein product [Rotaria sp. Silwood2]|nr:unnamed protein product [Rotaria sp. Silwood2]CAF4111388.1 unnamed protein product [Rotaria sp. Silwood2]
MGNSGLSSLYFWYKVDFTRETPNDFYLSGDHVQGINKITANYNYNDFDFKYGPLNVELIGEIHDFTSDKDIFVNGLRSCRWSFDIILDLFLPPSLPPDDDCDPCICYYARVYLNRAHNDDFPRKLSVLIFTRTPISSVTQ